MVEVAPNMFFKKWDYIESGYLHPSGVFIIETITGQKYQTKPEDAPAAIAIWREQFPELRQEQVRDGVPKEIAFWIGKIRREKQARQG